MGKSMETGPTQHSGDRMPARLRDLVERLAASDSLRAGAEAIAWACDGVVPFYRVALVLPDVPPGRWHVAASWARSAEEELEGYVFSLEGHPLRAVVERGEPVVRTAPEEDAPGHPVSRLFRGEGKRWELAVPLPLGDRRGMLVLASRKAVLVGREQVEWICDVGRIAGVWARPWVAPDGPEVLRSQYETLLEGALDGIVVIQDRRIVYTNASFRELFGVSEDEAMDRPFESFLFPESRAAFHEAVLEARRRSRVLPRIEVEGRTAGGRRIPLDLGVQRIVFGGRAAMLIQVHNAVARAEREREARLRSEEIEALIRTLAHDIRTPLTTVAGFAELLMERIHTFPAERVQEMLELLGRSARAARALAEGLLEYGSLGGEEIPMREVHLEPTLRAVEAELQELIRSTGARIRYHRIPPVVWGRPVEIGRVFRNLMENALRYRRPDLTPEIVVSCTGEEGRFYVLCIEDNGRGIDPEHLDRVFDLLYRGDNGGTGIGLAIVARIVEKHGGRVWVESEPGQGSRFYLTLPKPPAAEP